LGRHAVGAGVCGAEPEKYAKQRPQKLSRRGKSMSMKRVKEAPIRHFYENIFYGEDLTSLSSDEMKCNLPKALERWDYPAWKKEICAARLIHEESFAELSERFHYSEGHIRSIIRTVETYLRRDGNYGIRVILLTGCDTCGESVIRKKSMRKASATAILPSEALHTATRTEVIPGNRR